MKMVNIFSQFGRRNCHYVAEKPIWNLLVSPMALKIKIVHSKINFGFKIDQKYNFNDFCILKIRAKFCTRF
tara:strand:- start:676 stop:888 length:213 start_codon:yes stop_codon:yes gene_type:complete